MRSEARKQFLLDIFTTAIEGGIEHWARINTYHWLKDGSEDLDGFHAQIELYTADGGGAPYLLDIEVIATGLSRALAAPGWGVDRLKLLREADRENDAGNIDAELADLIAQYGVLGDLVYS